MGGRHSRPSPEVGSHVATHSAPTSLQDPGTQAQAHGNQYQEPDTIQGQQSAQQQESSRFVHVGPSDVVFVGSSIVTAAAVISAVATYRSGSKSLMDDGINPNNRMRMIPVAFQTLMLSTLFTGVLGVGGFYALRAAGLFSQDTAELPSATEAARMLKAPRAYLREVLRQERQHSPDEPA